MLKYIVIVAVLAIAVILFLIFKNKKNNYAKIDSYSKIKESLREVPNEIQTPSANIEELDMEVNNGGFNQYFFNSSGQNCFETLRELRKVGKSKKAELLERAIEYINPGKLSERELIENLRNRRVSELDDDNINAKLDSLDQIYFKTVE